MASTTIKPKEVIGERLKALFKEDYVGYDGKRHYVNCPTENGVTQVAIALSVPTVPYAVESGDSASVVTDLPWDEPTCKPQSVSQEEQDNIASLFEKLGL